MKKNNKTILGIFTESVGLYFSNFDKFIKYMSFPVLGQTIGLLWICLTLNFYTSNMPNIMSKYSSLDNINILFICLILIVLPGMVLFLKSFWEYLVAYGAVNSMLENMLHSGKVYDFDAHTELVKRRKGVFIGIWCLISAFSLLALNPLLWVLSGVIGIFFILVFQVFTFEAEQNAIGCLRRSIELIKGHFVPTFFLASFVILLTYIFIPEIAKMGFNAIHVTEYLSKIFVQLISHLPLDGVENFFANYNLQINIAELLATSLAAGLIAQVFIQYTLPLRSILWSMWYKELNGGLTKIEIKPKKSSKSSKNKRPSEKLMEESHKKYGSNLQGKSRSNYEVKKLDKNILKRAMEKDDE